MHDVLRLNKPFLDIFADLCTDSEKCEKSNSAGRVTALLSLTPMILSPVQYSAPANYGKEQMYW